MIAKQLVAIVAFMVLVACATVGWLLLAIAN